MTAIVRIFTSSGLSTAPVVAGSRLSYDSVQLLKWPLLSRDLLTCDASTPDLSELSAAPDKTGVAYIQIEQGKTVYYEVIPDGFPVVNASNTSPTMSGTNTLEFGPGWRISVLEVA